VLFALAGVALTKFFFVEHGAGDRALVPDEVMRNRRAMARYIEATEAQTRVSAKACTRK
jgi:hypothetical protein